MYNNNSLINFKALMNKMLLLFTAFGLLGATQYDYSLEDINPSSDYYGEDIGTSYFPDQVTLHYFGHYN